ncbi:MAG TPA: Omp28 family outer membrane lipoprotein [Bacteroidales bacterium]|nr:Omp28 family outer membrane lipoprotein [Bacteroidales bacterium]
MKYRIILIGLLSIIFTFQSCNKVEESYLIETGEIQAKKTILIEEFTGHQCPNCPRAAKALDDIVDTYGDRIVIVAIHANYNGRPTTAFPADYRTEVGNALDTKFKMEESGLPKSMVNRTGFLENNHKIKSEELAGKVGEIISEDPLLDIKISNNYDEVSRKTSFVVSITLLEEMQRKMQLSVFITESNIVSPQKNSNPDIGPTPQIDDYVHNHVLRGSVNGAWGDIICIGNLNPAGTNFSRPYQYTLDPEWNENNCSLVAFVYDGDTFEVLQAAEVKVK